MWVSVEVVVGVRIVQCHAIMDVVIGVRVMQYHAIIDVVIGVRVMLCHQAIDNSGFSTFLNFPLRVQILILSYIQSTIMKFPLLVPILILLSDCINSSLFPVAILCTLLHRENTSFEVCGIYKKHIMSLQKLILNPQDLLQNRSLETVPACIVLQYYPHSNTVCIHKCEECNISIDSSVCHKLWSIL